MRAIALLLLISIPAHARIDRQEVAGPYHARTSAELVKSLRVADSSRRQAFRGVVYEVEINGEPGDLLDVRYRVVGTLQRRMARKGANLNFRNGAHLYDPATHTEHRVIEGAGGYNITRNTHHASYDRSTLYRLEFPCGPCFVRVEVGCYNKSLIRRLGARSARAARCTVNGNGYLEATNVSRLLGAR